MSASVLHCYSSVYGKQNVIWWSLKFVPKMGPFWVQNYRSQRSENWKFLILASNWLRIAAKWDTKLVEGALESWDSQLSNAQKFIENFWFPAILRPEIGRSWLKYDHGRKSAQSGRNVQILFQKATLRLKKPQTTLWTQYSDSWPSYYSEMGQKSRFFVKNFFRRNFQECRNFYHARNFEIFGIPKIWTFQIWFWIFHIFPRSFSHILGPEW